MTALQVEVIINADPATVWEKWNNPKDITQWAFASDEWEASQAENDLREGGTFVTVMGAKDKSAEFEFKGTYTRVINGKFIEYMMDDNRTVEIMFEQVEGGTKIIQLFEPESENPAEMQQSGWQAILNNFKRHVESGSASSV